MRPLLILLAVLTLSGCANNKIAVESRRSFTNPAWEGGKPYEVLVVGYAYEAATRNNFESEMVRALRAQGVNARASYELWPLVLSVDLPTIQQYFDSSEHSAILVAREASVVRDERRVKAIDPNTLDSLMRRDPGKWTVDIGVTVETLIYVNDLPSTAWATQTLIQASDVDINQQNTVLNRFIQGLMRELRQGKVVQRLKAN